MAPLSERLTGSKLTNLELHAAELVEDVVHVVTDRSPRDLIFALCRCFDRVTSQVVESYHVTQHPYGLVERAKSMFKPRNTQHQE